MKINPHSYLRGGIILIILASLILDYSYAQEKFDINQQIPDILIFVQTFVMDPEKQLVAYLTSNQFTYIDTGRLHPFLDSVVTEHDQSITINAQKFQIIKREQTVISHSESVVASTLLVETVEKKPVLLARFTHDGFPVQKGDQITSIWTFIRPIN